MATIPVPCSADSIYPLDSNKVGFDVAKRRHGVCKFFNSQKGFGFINDDRPDELGNQEVFVHYTAITSIVTKGGFRSLAEGEEVEYSLQTGKKGFQAAHVSGPSGRAVQGDPKAKLPKSPTVLPYQTMIPAYSYMFADPQGQLYSPVGGQLLLGNVGGMYPTMSPAMPLNGTPLNGPMRSPQQSFVPSMVSPPFPTGFAFNNAASAADGMRSPPNAGLTGFAGHGFGIPSASGLGLRSDGSRVSVERGGMDDGTRGVVSLARGGGGGVTDGVGVGVGGVNGTNSFVGFGSNSLLYSSNGQGGF